MDTDVTLSYDFIVQRCADSKYSIDELENILFNEVLPALRFNMFILPAPEWAGFQSDRKITGRQLGKRFKRFARALHKQFLKLRILRSNMLRL
jgi:hypothetical protein